MLIKALGLFSWQISSVCSTLPSAFPSSERFVELSQAPLNKILLRQKWLCKFCGIALLQYCCLFKKYAAVFKKAMHTIDTLIRLQKEKMSEVNVLFLHLLNFHEFSMSRRVSFVSQ